MRETFLKLEKKFEEIKQKGYIKGIYNSSSSIGRTFEQELGLPMNKESMPDYEGIEIKTRRTYSKGKITLFNAVPDGEEPLEIVRLKDTYGYPYYKDRNYKCLYAEISATRRQFSGRYYRYKLDVDRNEQRIYLCIYDLNGRIIERRVYWSFNYLKEKLQNKLTYLALIHAWPKEIDNWNYFNYYKINFYKLKPFEKFIDSIENGKIIICLKVDIYLDEANYGKVYDHGCSFEISEDSLTDIFYRYIIT